MKSMVNIGDTIKVLPIEKILKSKGKAASQISKLITFVGREMVACDVSFEEDTSDWWVTISNGMKLPLECCEKV